MFKTNAIKIVYILLAFSSVVLFNKYYATVTVPKVEGTRISHAIANEKATSIPVRAPILHDGIKTEVEQQNQVRVTKNVIDSEPMGEQADGEVLQKLEMMFDRETFDKIVVRYQNGFDRRLINSFVRKNISKDEMRVVLAPLIGSEQASHVSTSTAESTSRSAENENPYKELQENPSEMLHRIENAAQPLTPDNPYYNLVRSLETNTQ